jgi:hypothetical protein
MSHRVLKVILCISIFSLSACSAKYNNVSDSEISEPIANQPPPTDTIAFLLFNIQNNNKSKSSSNLSFKSITKNVGKLKNTTLNQDITGDKLCFYFYNMDNIVDSLFIEHPLKKNVEIEDENNHLVTKQLDLDKTEFFIRIQLKDEYKSVKITEWLNGNINSLTTILLK